MRSRMHIVALMPLVHTQERCNRCLQWPREDYGRDSKLGQSLSFSWRVLCPMVCHINTSQRQLCPLFHLKKMKSLLDNRQVEETNWVEESIANRKHLEQFEAPGSLD